MASSLAFKPRTKGFETTAIHAAWKPGDFANLNSVVPPIILSTSFKIPDVECTRKKDQAACPHYQYSRFGNPNRDMLERTISALEGSKYTTCYASGIGAVGIMNLTAKPGDHILCVDDVYAGTYKFYENYAHPHGVDVTYTDLTRVENIDKFIKPNTKILWLETPTNPLNKILDIVALSAAAKKHNPDCKVVVDSSFLSPYNLKPLELGADVSLCSLTKYINGHSDVTLGAISTNSKELHDELQMMQISIGVTPSPMDCYLTIRGLKTLGCRMRQHMESALKVAYYLKEHSLVEKVLYPGLPSHPNHETALNQWYGLSGMLSFYLKGDIEQTLFFTKNLTLFSTSYSYGGYESLVEVPFVMSGTAYTETELKENGITETLVRMSVGLETVEDLIEDIDNSFKKVCSRFCKDK